MLIIHSQRVQHPIFFDKAMQHAIQRFIYRIFIHLGKDFL